MSSDPKGACKYITKIRQTSRHMYRVRVFNATFNNISVISRLSVLVVEEAAENHQPVANHRQTLSIKIHV
jgi:hypothetical protein